MSAESHLFSRSAMKRQLVSSPSTKLIGCTRRSVPHIPGEQGLHAGHRTHLAQEVAEPMQPRGDYMGYNLSDRTQTRRGSQCQLFWL